LQRCSCATLRARTCERLSRVCYLVLQRHSSAISPRENFVKELHRFAFFLAKRWSRGPIACYQRASVARRDGLTAEEARAGRQTDMKHDERFVDQAERSDRCVARLPTGARVPKPIGAAMLPVVESYRP
jgi:hypothetical protein